jgi:hypothetical protein
MESEQYEQIVEQTALAGQVGQQAQAAAAAQYYVEEKERTIIEAQLECEQILEKVKHMVRQDKKVYKEDGSVDWLDCPENERMLTDWGCNRIMQTMEAYVNKENLLSNYDTDIVNRRMLSICQGMRGNFFMKYELYFRIPTVEECLEIIRKQEEEDKKINTYIEEQYNIKQPTFKETKEKLLLRIEEVKERKHRENRSEWGLLFTELIHIIESVHQRAWKGQERSTIRTHTNISEVHGVNPVQQKQGGFMSKWIKG